HEIDIVLQPGDGSAESDRVRSMNEAEAVTEHKAVLGNRSWKPGGSACGTENPPTREVIIVAHFSFGNPNVRPLERRCGLRGRYGSDIPNPCFVEPRVIESVSVRERENREAR